MRPTRVRAMLVVLAGGISLSSSPAEASGASRGFCGVCHSDGCPTGSAAEGSCQTVCGGSETMYCTWSPFCMGGGGGGPLLVCFPEEM